MNIFELLLLSLVSFAASALTLFSGFGLGTLLMPVFALFFPLSEAVALTAAVHFLNNVLKLSLLGKFADKKTVLYFGLPAFFAAWAGAALLLSLESSAALWTYSLAGRTYAVLPVKLAIAGLILFFVILENLPAFHTWSVPKTYLPLGGLVSGFLGGLSGHQGALRAAFLNKCGLDKNAFIGTGIVIACLVDISRLGVYSRHFTRTLPSSDYWPAFLCALFAAFAGVWASGKFLKKITLQTVQKIVSGLLILIALLLAAGII